MSMCIGIVIRELKLMVIRQQWNNWQSSNKSSCFSSNSSKSQQHTNNMLTWVFYNHSS